MQSLRLKGVEKKAIRRLMQIPAWVEALIICESYGWDGESSLRGEGGAGDKNPV
jgi:hypothetical protein